MSALQQVLQCQWLGTWALPATPAITLDSSPEDSPTSYSSTFSLGASDDDDGVDFNPEDYSEVWLLFVPTTGVSCRERLERRGAI